MEPENRLTVHLAAVADSYNKDFQRAVLNARNNPVIAYAVLPELAQSRAFEGFPDAAWIVQG